VQADIYNGIASVVGGWAKVVRTKFDELRGEGKSTIDAWIGALNEIDWGALWDDFAEKVKPLTNLIVKLWFTAFEQIRNFIIATLGDHNFWIGLGKIAVSSLWSAFKAFPRMLISMFTTTFETIVENIKGLLNKIPGVDIGGGETAPAPTTEAAPTPEPTPASVPSALPEESAPEPPKSLAEQAADLYKTQQGSAKASQQKALLTRAGEIMSDTGMGFDAAAMQAQEEQRAEAQKQAAQDVLEAKKGVLDVEQQIADNQRQQVSLQDKIATSAHTLRISLNEMAADFKKGMIEGVDSFAQKFLSIKDAFSGIGGIFEKLGLKKLDIFARVGEDAGSTKTDVLRESFKASQAQLAEYGESVSTGERAGLLEKLAERATALFEAGDTGAKEDATKYITQALEARKQEETNKLEAAKIDKETALKNVEELKAIADKTQSAGARAEALQQLSESLESLGQWQDVAKLQPEIEKAMRASAEENTGILKSQLERLDIIAEILLGHKDAAEQQLEESKKIREATENQQPFAFDPELVMA
jgi:hypothetical protein